MNSPTISDLTLLIPELILVVMALTLILAARRIRRSNVAVVGTVLAALAAGGFLTFQEEKQVDGGADAGP